MATNVPLVVDINGRRTEIPVDQSANQGRWNSLGVFELPAGRNSAVVLSNRANGYVLADAIKFRLVTEEGLQDSRAPAPPRGVRVSQND